MEEISAWLINILSVVVSGVLVDLLLPNGKLNGFIRAVFGFLAVTVIISPLPKLLNKQININDMFYNSSATEINQDFVDANIKKLVTTLENSLEMELFEKGYENVVVKFSYIIEEYNYTIQKVNLNIKNLVINSNGVHINKYTEMRQITCNFLGVSSMEVEFNE